MAGLFILLCILGLSPEIEEKLDAQGFVIVPTMKRNIYDIYESAKKHNEPILVTSDLVLYTSHILFDYTLRVLELETLLPKLEELTKGMIEASQNQAKKAKNVGTRNEVSIQDAALDNLAFFGVAGNLLGIELPEGIPEQIIKKINREVKLIKAHEGPVSSPIFGYQEDYTQYIPRGHYTRNADFEQYFQAMMWYGRMGFYLKPNPTMYLTGVNPVEEGIKLTRRAILITNIIKSSPKLAKLWKDIYKPTTFFAGKSDDFTIEDYEKLLKNINPAKDKSVQMFIKSAERLPPPQITSTLTEDTLGLLGFRFMGQRFIPDSYIFQNLVYPKVMEYHGKEHPFTLEDTPLGGLRCFPRGLDVMFVLGSSAAGDILKQEGDTDYALYNLQVKKLQAEFQRLPPSQWSENLYWRWLWVLKNLVTHSHQGCPEFMRGRLWRLKELNSALGSWAELRHDTILYGKQSYTLMTVGHISGKGPKLTEGWVEPYPEIYKWLSDFIKELAETSEYPDEIRKNLSKYAEILERLITISNKELEDKLLTEMEHRLIWNIGSTLKGITQFSPELMRKITDGADEEMAIVADVHTDPNSKQVLEEAVGYPSIIYVKLPGKVVKGGVFSYYEFKAPMDERYTDEKWQEDLRTNPPKLQKWFLSLLNK